MVVVHGLDNYRSDSGRTAVAIGNFDGLHLGHRKILARLRLRARESDLSSSVLTFFPHPERVLGKKETLMIQTLDQRLGTIEEVGIDTVVVTAFDDRFSSLSPSSFVESVLVKKMTAAEIVVGRDFRFGRNRQGNARLLRRLGDRFDLSTHIIAPEIIDRKIVSSSAIRGHLRHGRIGEAALFLGRPYEIMGTVIRGRSRGKSLGFPTANLRTENEILPEGVFITRTIVDTTPLPSLTSIGSNPTFADGHQSVETYLLDFSENLYGRNLTVLFLERIRKTLSFNNPSALVIQMKRDLARAEAYFEHESGRR